MSKYKITDVGLQAMLYEMRGAVKTYKAAPDSDKLMPSINNKLEMIRWGLGAILTHLDDEEVRKLLGPEVSAEIDEAIEIKNELIKNIASMWEAEAKV